MMEQAGQEYNMHFGRNMTMMKKYGMFSQIALAVFLLTAFSSAGASAFDWPGFGGGKGPSKKVQNLFRQARSAYGSADYSKVIDLTTKAIKADKNFAKAYALRGKARKDMGDVDKAFADLDTAIKLDPNLGEAYYIRGQTNEIMGDMDKAAADYKKGCSAGFKDACR